MRMSNVTKGDRGAGDPTHCCLVGILRVTTLEGSLVKLQKLLAL